MARTLNDTRLDTRAARRRLKRRREPHWRSISEGLAVGYRKGTKGGTRIARHYSGEHGRRYHSIGTTDDIADADGAHVLSFPQAQEAARRVFGELARHDRGEGRSGPYTVRDCAGEYLTWLKAHRKTGYDARHRVHTHIVPHLGHIQCDRLTTADTSGCATLPPSPPACAPRKMPKRRISVNSTRRITMPSAVAEQARTER